MEFYGSIDSVSGSITASVFTGSFKGDGGNLYNIQASGVTGLNLSQIASGNATASISSTGFTVNKNTQIQGDLSVTGSIIATNYIVSSSVTYMTTSFASGSTAFGDGPTDIHQFSGSVKIEGNLSLNGTAVGTGKLDETTFQSYTSSISSSIGSLSSSIALTDVSQSNRLTTIEGNYATTGSNLFKGSQTISGSITPSVDNTYDLGSPTYQWRDVYISSGSLYIDGTKVLGSTSQELTITTDTGQSIKILEAGSDSIILQSADGDIELKSSGGGDILFDPTSGLISIKGTTQIQDGFKITSSGGTNIVFGDSVIVSGSIELTGNVDGIDLQSFSSSVSASISSLLGGNTSLSSSIATTTSGLSSSINSLSSSVATTTSGLTSTITSVSSSLTSSIGSLSSSLATTTSGLSSSIGSLSSSIATTTSGLSSSIATTTSGLSSSVGSLSSSIATTTSGLSSSVATTTSELSSSIGSLSSSIATTTSGLTSTITSLSSSLTSSIGSLSSSINSTIGSLSSSVSASIGNLSSSVATITSELSSSIGSLSSSIATTTSGLSSSIATTTLGTKNRVDSIETTTGSLNTFSSSINTTIKSKLDSESVISGSIQVIITGTTGYSTFSSSVSTSIGALSSSVATTTSGLSSSIDSLSSSVATTTSGLSSSIGSLSSSVATTTLGTKNRVDSIESKTGSYATTGSNIFQGDQTITGSLYVSQNLIIAGSSSIQNISSSVLNIADNIITVNALNPSVRFGGLAVIDSGSSPQVSGSMLFDSVNNQWLFVHQNQASVTSSVLLMGPETYNNLGNESYITANRLVKSTGIEHLTNSNISDDGTTVTMLSNTIVNGTFSATGTTLVSGSSQITFNGISGLPTLVSGSSQINHNTTTNYVANQHIDHTSVSISAGNGLSGGGDISSTRTITLDTSSATFTTGVKTKLNADGVVSGSSQISFNGITDKPTLISGSAQISFNGITDKPTLVSGSSQIDLTATTNYTSGILTRLNAVGVVSGSSQIDLTATTNYASGILTRLNAVGVFSGSAQVTGIGNAQLTNSSFNIGTTSISLGRASASQTLTGVSIDGNAATVTGGVYTSGDQTIAGTKTFSNRVVFNSAVANRPQLPGGMLGLDTGDGDFDIWGISRDYYPSHATAANAWGLRWNGANNDFEFVGGGTSRVILDMAGGNVTATGNVSATGTIGGSNYSGTHTGASSGTNTGDETLARVNALAITTVGTITSGTWNGTTIAIANGGTGGTTTSTARTNLGLAIGTDVLAYRTFGTAANSATGDFAAYNATHYVGTTAIAANRASASQTLTGVSIDGNAATSTIFNNGSLYVSVTNGNTLNSGYSNAGDGSDIWINYRGYNDAQSYFRDFRVGDGKGAQVALFTGSNKSLAITGAISASNLSGTNTGDQTNISGTASNITAYTINQSVGTGNAPTFAGGTINGSLYVNANNDITTLAGSLTLYSSGNATTSMMMFKNTTGLGYGNHGAITGTYNTYFVMDTTDRGWIWRNHTTSTNIASISNTGTLTVNGNVMPTANGTQNLGGTSNRWSTVYTSDLSLNNGIGDYTIVEGEEKLYLYNNKNNKVYSFVLQEEDPSTATPKKS